MGEEEAVQQAEGRLSREQYIEELAGPEDYWMTITDAARATRRQDVTIRRWIASGELPVRKQRVGLNKRSRQIRASDVAQLTPIIDTSAMISGDEAKINLTNIPAEHSALRADHQRLLAEFVTLQNLVAEQKQATIQALVVQQESWQQALATAQEAFQQQFLQQQGVIETHQQEAIQARADLLTRLTRQAKMIQQHQQQLKDLQETLFAQQEQHQQMFREQRGAIEAIITHQRAEVEQKFRILGVDIAQINTTIANNAEMVAAQLEQFAQSRREDDAQRRQELQDLKSLVQEGQQVAAQQVAMLVQPFADYQASQQQILQQTEARLSHLQNEDAHMQQEQDMLAQHLTALTARLTEYQSHQEQLRQQAEEHYTHVLAQLAQSRQGTPEQKKTRE